MPVDGDIILKAGLDASGVNTSIKNLSKSISKSLKNAIRIVFGVRSVFALIRKMRTALFEGFKDLAQVHQPFNEAMSNIMTSLRLLRNTFAAAFAPIVETVAPILSNFINMIAKAVASVGQFIAALTGKEYVQAGAVQINYAASVDKSTNSSKAATNATKKQTKAQKELNREITHFDDLVILHDKNKDDTSSPTTAQTTPDYSFSTMPVGQAVSQFAKDFLAAWDKADFTEIGRKVGEKIKKALDDIPWTKIKSTLSKIAKSIATFLNGYMETPGLYTTFGKTIAEGINSAFTFVYSFITNFHWDSWGKAIKDKITGLLENLDWPLIYATMKEFGSGIGTALESALDNPRIWSDIFTTLSNGLNGLVLSAKEFLGVVGWESLGSNITFGLKRGMENIEWENIYAVASNFGTDLARFLNGLFDGNTFEQLGITVANLLTTAFEFLNHFGDTFDFVKFGNSLARGINRFLSNFRPSRLAAGIHKLVYGFRDAVIEFLGTTNWYKLGTTIRDLIKEIKWKGILLSVGKVIWEAINAGIKFFKGIFDADNISSPFTNALKDLSDTISEAGRNIDFSSIAYGFESIVRALEPVGEGFGKGFINVFNVLFDIGTVFLQSLGPILTSIGEAISSIDPRILESVGVALGTVVAAFVTWNGLTALGGILRTMVSPVLRLVGGLAAHPLLAIGVGLGSIVVGLENLTDSGFFADADSQKAIENCQAVIEETKEVRRQIQETLDEAEGKHRDIDATYGVIRNLATEYFQLKEKVSLTREEQERLNTLEGELSKSLPGFQSIIGDTTTKYSDQKTAVFELIGQTEAYYKVLAAEEYMKDYYSRMFELDVAIQKNRDSYDQLMDSYDGGSETTMWAGSIVGWYMDMFNGTKSAIQDNEKEYAELLKQQKALGEEYNAEIKVLETYGGSVDDVTTSVSDLAKNVDGPAEGMENLGKAASTSNENTSGLADAFDVFKGLSLSTPLKLALISAAIKLLGDKGETSEEQIGELYDALDSYKADPTEKNLEKVQKAFENTGISADDFVTLTALALSTLDESTQKEIGNSIKTIKNSGKDLKSESKESYENVGEGAQEALEEKSSDVSDTAGDMMEDTFDEMDSVAESNSPSKRAKRLGGYIIQGLQQGLNNSKITLTNTVKTIMQSVLNLMENKVIAFKNMGSRWMTNLNSGMSSMSKKLSETGKTLATNIYNSAKSLSFWNVGYNIAAGIYNGLIAQNETLKILAWNTAVSMYNSACKALGIASPSKEFAWIGGMIVQGLGKGITDSQDIATTAVSDVTQAITDEAEKTNPAVTISTTIDDWINSLDYVLTTFSETIIDKFDSMMNTLIQLSNVSVFTPAVAQGRVVPSSMRSIGSGNDDTSNIMRMLESMTSNQMTLDELRTLLVEMFNDYMNLGWYIGDEQLARHVNNGNLILNRRYSIIK